MWCTHHLAEFPASAPPARQHAKHAIPIERLSGTTLCAVTRPAEEPERLVRSRVSRHVQTRDCFKSGDKAEATKPPLIIPQ